MISTSRDLPDDSPAQADDNRAEAKAYARQQLYCDLLDKALDAAFLAVAAFLLAGPLDAWLGGFALLRSGAAPLAVGGDALRVAALFLVVNLLHEAVSFPLSYYAGYTLEHRYGLSRLSRSRWLGRHFKFFFLATALGAVLVVGLYAIIWSAGAWWWWIAAGAFFLVSVVLGRLLPVVFLPMFYTIQRLDDEELTQRMRRLAAGTGLSVEGVYRLVLSDQTVKANAMLAGVGRTRRILLGDTLLEDFSHDEIEVVLAHEIGHHVHRHIGKLLVLGAVISAGLFWSADRVLALWTVHTTGHYDAAMLPVAALPLLLLLLTLGGMLLEPLRNALSRHFERQCDRYALERTGKRAAFVSAMLKLARINKADPDPHPLEVFLFHDHPPIRQRVALAEG